MGRAMKDSGVEWIGEIPYTWSVFPMKSVIISNDGGIWGYDPIGDGSDKVVIRSTEQSVDGKWQITTPATRNLSGLKFHRYKILPGDLLMTKSSGSNLHIGKTTLADQYFAENECYYSNFIQRIRVNQSAKFYWYILNSTIAHDQFIYLQNTTSGLGNINANDIEKIYVPVPTIDDQCEISCFLDERCAKIDSIIGKTRASIEEYKHLKQAVITQAVTKGVCGDRPMKESGIEWLKEIPSGWSAEKGKRLFVETNERSEDGNEELLTVSHITGVTPRSQKNVNMFMAETLTGYKVCHVGDIAANTMWMWQGAIGVSKYQGVISPSYNTYRQSVGAYDSEYLDYLLRAKPIVGVYNAYSTGITISRLRLYPEQFFSIVFPIPPMDEQKEIAAYLDEKCTEIDALIAKKEQLLTELESYKKSLIYEYVTGKKEV